MKSKNRPREDNRMITVEALSMCEEVVPTTAEIKSSARILRAGKTNPAKKQNI
jgi:hypothetical protein